MEPGENVTFNNTPPIELVTEEAKLQLRDGILLCQLEAHYETEIEARSAIEPILRAWELDAAIRGNLYGFRFIFEKAEIIDRTPIIPEKSQTFIHVGSTSVVITTDAVKVHVGWAKYPDPPLTLRITPDVESLWNRYKGYVEGREPLLSMAYFCLSVIETNAGGRPRAAKIFGIQEKVLSKLGELTSKRGDRLTGRKVRGTKPMQPLTGPETTWILSVIKTFILRIGDTRDITALPKITMADLPRL